MLAKVKVLNNDTRTYLSNLTIGEWFLFNGNLFIATGFDVEAGNNAEAVMIPSGIPQFLNKNNLVEKVIVNITAKRGIAEE